MSRVYDLKGSTYERTARKKDGTETSSVLKDLDWILDRMKIDVNQDMGRMIKKTLETDTKQLQKFNVMDYS